MPRIAPQTRDEIVDPVGRRMYERKFGSMETPPEAGTRSGTPGDWELVIGRVPDVLDHVVRGFALWSSPDRQLDALLRELAQTRVGWAYGCQFVFSQHCKGLRACGASEEQIAALPHWQASEAFSPAERSVLAYTDCLAFDHGRVPDGTFAELRRYLSDAEIIELTYITSMYAMFAGITRALRLEFDDRDDPVVEVPAPDDYEYSAAWSQMDRTSG